MCVSVSVCVFRRAESAPRPQCGDRATDRSRSERARDSREPYDTGEPSQLPGQLKQGTGESLAAEEHTLFDRTSDETAARLLPVVAGKPLWRVLGLEVHRILVVLDPCGPRWPY